MDVRLSLQALAAQHQLSDEASSRLAELAGLDDEPAGLENSLPFGIAVLGAALAGLGIIFWVAANWDLLSRAGRFGLLQAVIVVMCAGAIFMPMASKAMALLALLGIGALFAFFGQTYQTGADPWQLFALWAALSLPLCLAVRHDVLWTPWALVAMSAITLWIHAHASFAVMRGHDLPWYLAGWSAAVLLVLALHPRVNRYTGAGAWSMRVAATLTALLVATTGTFALLGAEVAPQFYLALAIVAGTTGALGTRRLHDTFALSALGLALNVLLVVALADALIDKRNGEPIVESLIIGLAAAALLAATVKLVIGTARKYATGAPA